METTARTRLAHHVRMLRIARGWSQEVLAELSGLHRSYVGAVERGEHNIGVDNIEKLAHALGQPITVLIAGPETPPATAADGPAVIAAVRRQTFLRLLRRCRGRHQDILLTYLARCGVRIID